MFKPLLRKSASRYSAAQRFGQTVIHYEKLTDSVIVVVKDNETASLKKYKTQYLIAADGNRSATRKKEGLVGNSISIYFKANLVPFLGTRAAHGAVYITNKEISGIFRLDAGGMGGFLIVNKAKGRETGFEPDSVSEKEAKQFFADCSGINHEDCNIKIESISYWSLAAYTADRFTSKDGRVYIMGDAAHVMPPTGGMGGNTGVADAYNLAWKLAYVLKGHASTRLLETYDQERQKAAAFNMEQAFSRLVNRVYYGKGYDHEPELPEIVCELGYRFDEGAICSTDNANSAKSYEDPYDPFVLPGGRLPHVALKFEKGILSSLDLVKQNFVVFTTESDSPWLHAAQQQDTPVDVFVINSTTVYQDENGAARHTWKLAQGEALLVRPDGIIAWRSGTVVDLHDTALKQALNSVLKV